MPLSYSTYTGDASTTSFAITFDYLPETVVVSATPAGILVYLDDVKQTSGYSLVGTNIVFGAAPGSGVDIRIVRSTPRGKSDRLVDYEDSTTLTSALLDTSALQLLYIAQEAFEQSTSGGGATPTYLPYSNTLAAWDAESQKVSRVATPVAGTDAVNKTYADEGFLPYDTSAGTYDAARSGANKKIDGVEDPQGNQQAATKKYVDDIAEFGVAGVPQSFKFTADGSTNTFTLTALPYAVAEMLVVGLDGVLQLPGDDYTVTRGAVNSTLNFVNFTPANDQVINVLNFGRARFIDSALLENDSITTEMLQNQAVETLKIADENVTEIKLATDAVVTDKIKNLNVTTPKIADGNVTEIKIATDAVTEAKIADESVDFQRLKRTGFLSAANAGPTAQVLRVNSNTANLTSGTLAAADITDFNSSVTANPISAFGAATGTVNMDSNFLTNVPDPTAAQHAATKAYVDANTQSAMKGTLITDTTLASAAPTFTVEGWFDDSKYLYYEVHCIDFRVSDDGACVGVLAKTSGGSYLNNFNDYYVSGSGINLVGNSRNGAVTPGLVNTTATGSGYASFVLRLQNNNSLFGGRKTIQSTGSSSSTKSFGAFPQGDDSGVWSILTTFTGSLSTIQGLRFRCIAQSNATATSGSLRANARVLVYGYEGLS
jgi:hypothetical protein